ncbi:hypothetical protein D9M71_549340 [compost metagenome]
MQTAVHPQEHARRVGGFGEDAVHMVAPDQLQAERHATRTTADTAGQVDKQRILGIHRNALFNQLAL